MTSPFARMAAHVTDGAIKIVELQAVPRSQSTVLGRCLNESGATSLFINEPFNNMRDGDLNIAAGHVVEAVEPVLSSAHEPVVVFSKNMAHYLSASVFGAWIDACSAVVWCIRDPRMQLSSLVTRLANDMLFGPGSDRLKQSDLPLSQPLRSPAWPGVVETVTEMLRNSRWSTDFSATGWRAIAAHYTDCVARQSFVADGSLFSRVPERFLRYLCGGLGIEFRAGMIDGWQQPFLNANRLDSHPDRRLDPAQAWTGHAATSGGIEETDSVPLQASLLPTALRDHLTEVALPTYEMLTRAFSAQQNLAQYRLDRGLSDEPAQ
ncbi:hypothetical protein [Mycobacterium sp. 94-17]|uniref:hypothetical protein n=1 Tax=Mycobacterium sp. 94-17 TaxID=2986147 RepID=UPI002D1E9AA4|nr:hypothetical protein [Mycobacterium sp. 94-17]MEB4209148.1 hypothetical protein [Mycobacterium sp. 94-17]